MDLDFNFNEWAFMAQTNPEGFERYREQFIGQFLSTTGRHRPRLEALQACIDIERELAPTPEEALLAITHKMCQSLANLGNEVQELKSLLPPVMVSSGSLFNTRNARGYRARSALK